MPRATAGNTRTVKEHEKEPVPTVLRPMFDPAWVDLDSEAEADADSEIAGVYVVYAMALAPASNQPGGQIHASW